MALMNGTIAGLAGITPASGFIDSQASLGLGAVIGLCTFWTVGMFKHKLGIDDALDVSSVHGVSGIVGSIGVGFLATPAADPALDNQHERGLFYGGGLYLLRAQIIGVTTAFVWSATMTTLILYFTEYVLRCLGHRHRQRPLLIRVCEEDEVIGLDVAEYGQVGLTSMTEAERARAELHLKSTGATFQRTSSYETLVQPAATCGGSEPTTRAPDAGLQTLRHEHQPTERQHHSGLSSKGVGKGVVTGAGPPVSGGALNESLLAQGAIQ
jgi:hypothetical protein